MVTVKKKVKVNPLFNTSSILKPAMDKAKANLGKKKKKK